MDAKELKEKLFLDNKNGYLKTDEKTDSDIDLFAEGYKDFLNTSKTDRMAHLVSQ